MDPEAPAIDGFAEYQLCQSIITHLQIKKNASVHAINKALKIPDSKMIIRRKRFQEYFIRIDQNRFSLNDDVLRPMKYKLPLHPAAIPIQPPSTPEEAQKHLIQYQDHTEFPQIQFLSPYSIDPARLLTEKWVALDLEGFNVETTNYSLAQISMNSTKAILLDRQISGAAIHTLLQQILSESSSLEYICLHDLTCDVQALSPEFIQSMTAASKQFLDTQLIYEYFTQELYGGFNKILQYFAPEDLLTHHSKVEIGNRMKHNERYWFSRDLTAEQIHYAAKDVLLLHHCMSFILKKVVEESQKREVDLLQVWLEATKKRIQYSLVEKQRFIVFHPLEHYPITLELVEALAELSSPTYDIYRQMLSQYRIEKDSLSENKTIGSQLLPDLLHGSEYQSKHLLVLSSDINQRQEFLSEIARELSVRRRESVVVIGSLSSPAAAGYGTARVIDIATATKKPSEMISDLLASPPSLLPAAVIFLDLTAVEEAITMIQRCQAKQIRVIAGCSVATFTELLTISSEWNWLVGGIAPSPPPATTNSNTTIPRPLPPKRVNSALFDIAIELPSDQSDVTTSCRIFKDCSRTTDMYLQYGRGKGEMRVREIDESEGRVKIRHHFIEI